MKKTIAIVNNEQGSVLIMAILVLVLLTILAFTAMRTSTIERQIAGNELLHQKYFFTAEAGIDRAIKQLEQPFVAANAAAVRAGTQASWDFALVGAGDRGDGQGSYADGVLWVNQQDLDGAFYSVTLWNNDESPIPPAGTGNGAGGNFGADQDALIWLHSESWGPKGGGARVEVLLLGDTTGESVTGYTAQAGAGAGKNYNANDLNPITSFDRQL